MQPLRDNPNVFRKGGRVKFNNMIQLPCYHRLNYITWILKIQNKKCMLDFLIFYINLWHFKLMTNK